MNQYGGKSFAGRILVALVIAATAGCADVLVVHDGNANKVPSFAVIPHMVIPVNIIGAHRIVDTSNEDLDFAGFNEFKKIDLREDLGYEQTRAA